jgi:hypothetical protein
MPLTSLARFWSALQLSIEAGLDDKGLLAFERV